MSPEDRRCRAGSSSALRSPQLADALVRARKILVTIVAALRRATRRCQFSNPIPIPTNIHRIVGCCKGSAKLM